MKSPRHNSDLDGPQTSGPEYPPRLMLMNPWKNSRDLHLNTEYAFPCSTKFPGSLRYFFRWSRSPPYDGRSRYRLLFPFLFPFVFAQTIDGLGSSYFFFFGTTRIDSLRFSCFRRRVCIRTPFDCRLTLTLVSVFVKFSTFYSSSLGRDISLTISAVFSGWSTRVATSAWEVIPRTLLTRSTMIIRRT